MRQSHALLRCVAVLAVSLIIAGCGWRLQGTARLPTVVSVTYIDTEDRYTDFYRSLRDSLRASGARLTENRHDATAIIKIHREDSGQRVLTVSARNTPEEYEVFYEVDYSVADTTQELIPVQKLERNRDYSFNATAMLAKQREQAVLREALARDLAGLVVRRLASL